MFREFTLHWLNYLSHLVSQNFSLIAHEPSKLINWIGYYIVQRLKLGVMFLVQKIYRMFNNHNSNNNKEGNEEESENEGKMLT